ncbi:hypothetical protein [Microbacterium lacticum]
MRALTSAYSAVNRRYLRRVVRFVLMYDPINMIGDMIPNASMTGFRYRKARPTAINSGSTLISTGSGGLSGSCGSDGSRNELDGSGGRIRGGLLYFHWPVSASTCTAATLLSGRATSTIVSA